jgi:hypothetical protein
MVIAGAVPVDCVQELPGRRGSGGRDEHADPLRLQLWLLPSGIVGGHHCPQIVVAQHAGDQLRLGTAGHDRHGHKAAPTDGRGADLMLASGLLLLEVGRIPVRPARVWVPDCVLVPAMGLRSAPQRARQIAWGIKS